LAFLRKQGYRLSYFHRGKQPMENSTVRTERTAKQ